MTIPKLTPYTGQVANPDGSQTQTEFTQNMFDQLSYEAQFATQLDATIDGMNSAVDEVEANAVSAQSSANAAEAAASSADYKGLWPDTGGSALKGETWQTQVGGTGTGQYFTALQDTTVDPVGDNVNWKIAGTIGQQNISDYTDFVFKDLNSAINSKLIKNGDSIRLIERERGKGGGGFWDVVPAYSVTPNTYYIVQCTGVPALALTLKKESVSDARQFGAYPSLGGAEDITAAMQAYADYCSVNGTDFVIVSEDNQAKEYVISSPINFTANVSVFGKGAFLPRFLCKDCGLFAWPVGATNITVDRVRAGQEVRHTDAPNSHIAVTFQGLTGSRPYWNTVKNCFFDGFGINLNVEWAWEQRYRDNIFINCGQVVRARGTCVNNHVTGNGCTGNGLAFDIGDGTVTMEGWWISENLLDRFSGVAILKGCSYCKVIENIFDHIKGATGILVQGTGAIPAFGNHIKGNYIAFEFAASEGIRLLNNVASSQNTGSTIDDNEIFPYSGFTLIRGILIDGTAESDNLITKNKTKANTYDIDIAASVDDTVISDNIMQGSGFRTASSVFYNNNIGTVISPRSLLKRNLGENVESWSSNQPSSGTWKRGDKIWYETPGLDPNDMVLLGWIRLTDGSGNVPGTDWAAMRVSNLSPTT